MNILITMLGFLMLSLSPNWQESPDRRRDIVFYAIALTLIYIGQRRD